METTSIMMTESSELKNKSFTITDQLFKEYGWHLAKNEMNLICYTKLGNETDVFDIKIDTNDIIHVSVPIKNSSYNFVTSFANYFSASEYIESRLIDFIYL
jgi:hypothetical protein